MTKDEFGPNSAPKHPLESGLKWTIKSMTNKRKAGLLSLAIPLVSGFALFVEFATDTFDMMICLRATAQIPAPGFAVETCE